MKLTKRRLNRIVEEELYNVLNETEKKSSNRSRRRSVNVEGIAREELAKVLRERKLKEQQEYMPDPGGNIFNKMIECLQATGNQECIDALKAQDAMKFIKCIANSPKCVQLLVNY